MCKYANYKWINPNGEVGKNAIRVPFCTEPCEEWLAAAAYRDENGNSDLSYGLIGCDKDTQTFYVDQYHNIVGSSWNPHLRYYVPEIALKNADIFRPVDWNPPHDYISEANRVADSIDAIPPKPDTVVAAESLQADTPRRPLFGSVQPRRKRDLSPDSSAATHSYRSSPNNSNLNTIPQPPPAKAPRLGSPFHSPAPYHATAQPPRSDSMQVVFDGYQLPDNNIPFNLLTNVDIPIDLVLLNANQAIPPPLPPRNPARNIPPPNVKLAPYVPFNQSRTPQVIDASTTQARVIEPAFERPQLIDARRSTLRRMSIVRGWRVDDAADAKDADYQVSGSEVGVEIGEARVAVVERPRRLAKTRGRERVREVAALILQDDE
jgi:hypothetical protein